MRNLKFIAISTMLYLMLVGTSSVAAQQKTDSKEDETAIRANVEQMAKGWNAGSGEEFAKPFAENADYVVVNGMHLKSRRAIADGHKWIFDSIYKNSRNTATVESIRFVRPDVAITHVEWNLIFYTDGKEMKGHARSTILMTKENGKWEIASFQNTYIQPQKPAAK